MGWELSNRSDLMRLPTTLDRMQVKQKKEVKAYEGKPINSDKFKANYIVCWVKNYRKNENKGYRQKSVRT